MPRYLIDVNVPRDPSIWPADIAVYAIDLGPKWSDTKLWAHALDYDMTIVTKDADFSNRLMAAQRAPRIIHLKVGNMRLAEFRAFIKPRWPRIAALSEQAQLVQVYRDQIETLS